VIWRLGHSSNLETVAFRMYPSRVYSRTCHKLTVPATLRCAASHVVILQASSASSFSLPLFRPVRGVLEVGCDLAWRPQQFVFVPRVCLLAPAIGFSSWLPGRRIASVRLWLSRTVRSPSPALVPNILAILKNQVGTGLRQVGTWVICGLVRHWQASPIPPPKDLSKLLDGLLNSCHRLLSSICLPVAGGICNVVPSSGRPR
jgi:hypothetical protein